MAKKTVASRLINLVAWLTGIVVSLAVGFGLTSKTLVLPTWLGGASQAGMMVSVTAGWVVIVLTLAGLILAILNK
jgi:hypothetical protein